MDYFPFIQKDSITYVTAKLVKEVLSILTSE